MVLGGEGEDERLRAAHEGELGERVTRAVDMAADTDDGQPEPSRVGLGVVRVHGGRCTVIDLTEARVAIVEQ